MKKSAKLLAVMLCVLITLGTFAAFGCGETAKESYFVKYDLNYEGSTARTTSVYAGANAIDWRAPRDGYELDGWFTDAETTSPYDFTKPIVSDTTLYAKWKVEPGMATVTFDFAIPGVENKTVVVKQTNKIEDKYIPSYKPFGMKLVGWCKDSEKTQEWNFVEDKVAGDTTLYAKYEHTMGIPRNEDGSVAYNNVTIHVWVAGGTGLDVGRLNKITEKFNEEYKGKISVNLSGSLASQADTFLRIQQITGILHTVGTYYSVGEIYNFAGIPMDTSNWVEKATRESNLNGSLVQVPLVGLAPYFVYNKELLAKYSAGGALPTNYSQLSTILKAAYAGESPSNSKFKSILAPYSDWTYKEATSMAAFTQNGAPYYKTVDGKRINDWGNEAVYARAKTALQNTYDLFGANGANHGGMVSGSGGSVGQVSSGNALMGLVTWRGSETGIINNSRLGVLPISGLFTDETGEGSKDIPIHSIGIGFCNIATNVVSDPLKVCASAVYADWLSRNAHELAPLGYIPLSHEALNNEEYVNSTDEVVNFVKSVYGDINNLVTLPAMKNLKTLVNQTVAEGLLVPLMGEDGSNIETKMRELYSQIAALVY